MMRRPVIVRVTLGASLFLAVAAILAVLLYARILENRHGFGAHLVLLAEYRGVDPAMGYEELKGELRSTFDVTLPDGAHGIHAATRQRGSESWFEIAIPDGTGAKLKQEILASAQRQGTWRLEDNDVGVGDGSGSSPNPTWWNAASLPSRDFFGLAYTGTQQPKGPWSCYFNLSSVENRLFVWTRFSD